MPPVLLKRTKRFCEELPTDFTEDRKRQKEQEETKTQAKPKVDDKTLPSKVH